MKFHCNICDTELPGEGPFCTPCDIARDRAIREVEAAEETVGDLADNPDTTDGDTIDCAVQAIEWAEEAIEDLGRLMANRSPLNAVYGSLREARSEAKVLCFREASAHIGNAARDLKDC
jgi:hypothetical protein